MPRDGSLPNLRSLALHVHGGAEFDVANDLLHKLSIDRYLPKFSERKHGRRGPKVVERPLFPGYLFPRVDITDDRWEETWAAINGIRGVIGLLTMAHAIVAIPDREIAEVRAMEDERGRVRPDAVQHIARGAWVRMTSGPFASWDGHVVRTGMGWQHQRDAWGKVTASEYVPVAVVEVSLFGRRSKVEIAQASLERLDDPVRTAARR